MFLLQPLGTIVSLVDKHKHLLVSEFQVKRWKRYDTPPILKCDECSYMAISRTVLKRRTTMKHPNKEEPEALGKLVLEDSIQHFNSPDTKYI